MSTGRLEGKVAIITGGSQGIGRAATRAFADEGASVVVAARHEGPAAEVVAEVQAGGKGDAFFVQTDVSRSEDVRRLIDTAVERCGKVDVLYANAGMNETGTAIDTTEESWQRVMDVNLSGQFYLAKHGIPALAEAQGGSIILTASEFGLLGTKRAVAYCAAKGGVVNMTRALAVDCASYGIRVNCLTPGPILTPALLDWFNESDDPAAFEEAQTRPILVGRLGQPEEVAAAAVFLASDESSFTTGANLLVDGGVTSWYGI